MGSTIKTFFPAGADIGGSFIRQSDDQAAENNPSELVEYASGDWAPSIVGTKHAEPEFSITTKDVARVLALCDPGGTGVAHVCRPLATGEADMFFRRDTANAIRYDEADSQHMIYRAVNHIDSANPCGMFYWEQIQASQDQEATISTRTAITGKLSALTDQAVTAAELYEEDYTLGEVIIHGTHLDGLQSMNFSLNPEVKKTRSSGENFPSLISIKRINPVITVENVDLKQLAGYGTEGFQILSGSGGLAIYLRRRKPDLMNYAITDAVHLAILASAGSVIFRRTGGEDGRGSIDIRLRRPSAGTLPFTVSTAQTIPVSS